MQPQHDFPGTARFQVLRRLGVGGMGVVYEALDRERITRVALKTLRQLDAAALLRFKHEFRALQDLSHPNLVTLGELFEEAGTWFFTMELVQGVSLMRWVRPYDPVDEPRLRTETEELTQPAPRRPDGNGGSGDGGGWVARDGGYDLERLRAAFAQLGGALAALHRRGLVHRDVKPSNVLVTPAGRVVLLDFGVIADAGGGDGALVGTAAYMAPEQAAATARVGPAADWYAFGAVLYQALTGVVPFAAAPSAPSSSSRGAELVARKQRGEPPPPRRLAPTVPEDLDALCTALLRVDPATRPDDVEILRRLGAPMEARARERAFIGRARELGDLERAFAAAVPAPDDDDGDGRDAVSAPGGALVVVHGESGVGKSALVRHFAAELAARTPSLLVLAGRCYERESVSYKALDGVVDALTRWLATRPEAEVAMLEPREVPALAQLFPVLTRVPALAASLPQAPPLGSAAVGALPLAQPASLPAPRDPLEQRQRGFAGLRALVTALARRRPLLVIIDDLQWADADSLALLGELMRPPASPSLLVVATLRTARGDGAEAALDGLTRRLGLQVQPLGLDPLEPADARRLAHELLGGDDLAAAVIAAEAEGHPLFIDELVRHARAGAALADPPLALDDALGARVAGLPPDARRVLELVAVAGAPVGQSVAALAAALDFDRFARVSAELRAGHLVRSSGLRPGDTIEPYHDRVRQAVLRRLEPAARKMRHGRLALAMESSQPTSPRSSTDAERIGRHWAEAGENERAWHYAWQAARQAAGALAFDRAASLYREAAALEPAATERAARYRLRAELGEALSNVGRGKEAGAALIDAAAACDDAAQALELKRRAAEQFLRSGHIDQGLATMRLVLADVGLELPRHPSLALASLLVNRARLRLRGLAFRPRAAGEVAPELLLRVDTCLSVAVGLGAVDTIRGADFQARSLRYALEAGEPERLAIALALGAAHSSAAGGPARARTRELQAAAAQVAARIDSPLARGHVAMAAGVAAFLEGRFRTGQRTLREAEVLFRERCVGAVWEADSARQFGLWCDWHLGELVELRARVPRYIRDAEERGDLYAATNLRIGELSFVWLLDDDIVAARHQAAEAMRRWSHVGYHHQHWDHLLAETNIDLYSGDLDAAARRVRAQWPALRRSLLLLIQLSRIEARQLRARVALACAAAARGSERARLVAAARDDGRRLGHERMAWADPQAAMVAATCAHLEGREDHALAELGTAVAGFDAADMPFQATLARRALGRLVGGDAGRAQVAAADAWLAARAVRNPARVIAALTPGLDS